MVRKGDHCQLCWNLTGQHHQGCPKVEGADAAAKWQRGHDFGFDGGYLPPHRWRHHSAAYILGYRAGRAEIETLIDEEVKARNS
ncbi:MAG: hypothetical protein ACOZBH_02110 [Patescibacteria group bacterium]